MSEKVLIVDYDPFNMESRVYLMCGKDEKDTCKVASSIAELAGQLVGLASKHQVYSVKVRAPLAIMSEIKSKVAEGEMTLYSTNRIVVEGL